MAQVQEKQEKAKSIKWMPGMKKVVSYATRKAEAAFDGVVYTTQQLLTVDTQGHHSH